MIRAAIMALVVCLRAAAQTAGAETRGVVVDPSGAPVEQAVITLGKSRVTTDVGGRFRLTGTGELRVEKQGFQAYRGEARPGIDLRIELAVEAVRENVTVTDRQEQVSLEPDANVNAVTIQASALKQLPVEGNDVIAAASRLLNPGSLGDGGATVIVDGVQLRSGRIPASLVQEIRINQNPYSAEFQRPGTGRIEITTKGTAEEYHGEVGFLFRDSGLNARNALAAQKPDEQRRNYEAALEGPLGKGMSFFVSVEHEDDRQQAVVLARTPSGEIRENFKTPAQETEVTSRIVRKRPSGSTWSLLYEFSDETQSGSGVGGVELPESAYDEKDRGHEWRLQHHGVWGTKLTSQISMRIERDEDTVISRNPEAPRIVVEDAFTGGGGQQNATQQETSASVLAAVTWLSRIGTLRAGLSVPNWQHHRLADRSNFGGTYSYASLADYAADRPFSFVVQRGDPLLRYRYVEGAAFVQLDTKLRPNLAVGLGLRYDRQSRLGDADNFAPRMSLAWAPAKKTVLRGGFGLFYDRSGEGPIRDTLRFDGARIYEALIVAGDESSRAPSSVVRLAGDLRSPYLMHFSAGAERQVARRTTVGLTYVGLRGVGSFRSRDGNPPAPPDYVRRDPSLATLRLIESSGRMESNALEATLRGQAGRFNGQISYTFGKARNNTGGIGWMPPSSLDLSREWGRADFDRRNRFRALGTIDAWGDLRIGLGVEAQSGSPYSLTTGRDENRDGAARERPEGVARNTLQGPGAIVVDVRLSREFAPKDDAKGGVGVTVLADAFNVLNRANYTSVVGNLSSPFFGRPLGADASRRLQLGVRLSF